MPENKVKGLFKSFRHKFQIFDNEKEQEMQIGTPTDVKHVAHIGWDGPSVNSPSWMNEFKGTAASKSAPQPLIGDRNLNNHSDERVSQDSNKRGSRSIKAHEARDLPDLPKPSRRQSTGSITDSPKRDKTDKPKSSKKTSKPKDSTDGTSKPTRPPADSLQRGDYPASLPDMPKKPHRKKPKEASNGTSRSKLKAQTTDANSDAESPAACTTKCRNKKKSLENDGGAGKGSSAIS